MSQITYRRRSDDTLETELSALANVYRFVLEVSRKRKGTRPGAPDEPERRSDEIRPKASVP